MDKVIYANPANRAALFRDMPPAPFADPRQLNRHFGVPVVFDATVPAEQETGRVLYDQSDRFVELGPEDSEWALYFGRARREMEMVFYVVDTPRVAGLF